MNRYEYKVVNTLTLEIPADAGASFHEQLEAKLNALGQEGWRLMAVLGGSAMVFGRRLPQGGKP